jgi:hypothetical protein
MADVKRLTSPAQLWSIDDIDWEDVEVPEWDGLVVRIRALSAGERSKYVMTMRKIRGDQSEIDAKGVTSAEARLVAMSVIDEDGRRVFSEKDVEKLADKSGGAIGRLVRVAMRLSKLRPEDQQDAEGNSETGPNGSSSTG